MDLTIELVKLIPSFLWWGFVIALVILFYKPICQELLPNIIGLKAMGVEIFFIKDLMDAALELAEKSPQWNIEVPPMDKQHAINRAKQHLKVFARAKILWLDDHPENNLNERRMFRQLQAETDTAKNTEEALEMLRGGQYDLVISDMRRGDDVTAGLEFLQRFRKENECTPVIFYLGVFDPQKGTPAQAFGITNRPDELLHLTLDALERSKY
jgi:CheY-like chemotaxis protein